VPEPVFKIDQVKMFVSVEVIIVVVHPGLPFAAYTIVGVPPSMVRKQTLLPPPPDVFLTIAATEVV